MTNFAAFNGKTLKVICKELGLNYTTVTQRRMKDPGKPLEAYLYPARKNKGGNCCADYFTNDGKSVYQLFKNNKSQYSKMLYLMGKKKLSFDEAYEIVMEENK